MKNFKNRMILPYSTWGKTARVFPIIATLCLALAGVAALSAGTPPEVGLAEASVATGREAFGQGRFPEAEAAFLTALKTEPANVRALLGLGHLRLLQNRLDEAELALTEVLKLDPEAKEAKGYLAEAYVRRGRYDLASPLQRALGREPQARRLEAFKNLAPFAFEEAPESTEVPFVITDPLPVVQLKVNGSEAEFLIDTGAASLALDPSFAALAGATVDAEVEAVFAGGMKRALGIGRIDRVEIGGYKIRNVPVSMIPMGPIAAMFNRPLKGIVGTCFLYHFIFTLDYPGGRLVLHRRDPSASAALASASRQAKAIEIPLWLAGDHFMTARGRVNSAAETSFFIDTGMAGGGIGLSEAMAREAGIDMTAESREGLGGGGRVRVTPIVAKEVRLGEALVRDVPGNVGAGPLNSEFRDRLGFRMPVIISHAFFRDFRATFDLLNMRLFLDRPEPTQKPKN